MCTENDKATDGVEHKSGLDGSVCLTCGCEFTDSDPNYGGQVCMSCWATSH